MLLCVKINYKNNSIVRCLNYKDRVYNVLICYKNSVRGVVVSLLRGLLICIFYFRLFKLY